MEQERESEAAGDAWQETGYVHTTELGKPLDPHQDWADWYALLADAEVDPIKLHAARHYAVTILLLLGVQPQMIMHLLGWSTDQSKRYGPIVKEMLAEEAGKLETFHWGQAPVLPPDPSPFRPAAQRSKPARSSTDQSTSNVIQFRSRS